MSEQADKLLEPAFDLIKQVLRKHSVAGLEEMRAQVLTYKRRIVTLESELATLAALQNVRKLSECPCDSAKSIDPRCQIAGMCAREA